MKRPSDKHGRVMALTAPFMAAPFDQDRVRMSRTILNDFNPGQTYKGEARTTTNGAASI